MNLFTIELTVGSMGKAEKLRLRGAPENVEIVREGDTIIMRTIVDPARLRRACAEIRKHMPKPKKGESILRELNRQRLRGGGER